MSTDVLSNTFFALADPTRRAILAQLADRGAATVKELAAPFTISGPAISRHLRVLERAGLILRGRNRQFRPCTLDAAPLKEVAHFAEAYRKHWDENFTSLDAYLQRMKDEELTNDFGE